MNRPRHFDAEGVPEKQAFSPLCDSSPKSYLVLEPNEKSVGDEAQSDGRAGLWPDLEYIRKRLSVRDVARELGLNVSGRSSAQCWRVDAHQHGDRSASIYFTRKNRWRCAVCDGRTMSNLDLIQAVRGCDLRRAVEWVTARWNVPQVPRGRHAKRREPRPGQFRVGISGLPFEALVRSGLYAALSKAAHSLLPVILTYTDAETGWAVLSQRALRRHAGLSFRGVNDGLRELRKIGLLERERGPRQEGAQIPSCNSYRLNFEAPAFLELQDSVYGKHRVEVAFEVECQRERRKAYACWAATRSLRRRTEWLGQQSEGRFVRS